MQLRKTVLGLAAVILLASCGAKQITKAEAIKIAQDNYDSSNRVYKSAHYKNVIEVTYSDNVPQDARDQKGDVVEEEITDAEEVSWYRLDSNDLTVLDEKNVTFKADGSKLEITSNATETALGVTMKAYEFMKCDEIGYILQEIHELKTSTTVSEGVVYDVTVRSTITLTWTK